MAHTEKSLETEITQKPSNQNCCPWNVGKSEITPKIKNKKQSFAH